MNKKRAHKIYNELQKAYPNAKTVLNHKNNFEFLIAVILSAQTTDMQVNKVTDSLFLKYRGISEQKEIENFANVSLKEFESDISGVGLFRIKAKNINMTAKKILSEFNGLVPDTMDKLLTLPGVGRKTANVVLGNIFNKSEGIAVDTHVKRLSIKYGMSKHKDPKKIESDLMNLFEKKSWTTLTQLLIEHGRFVRKNKKDFIELLLRKGEI